MRENRQATKGIKDTERVISEMINYTKIVF